MQIQLRSDVSFHDGTPLTALTVAGVLQKALPEFMGAAFADIANVAAISADRVEIRLKRASPFLLEALEVQIRQPERPTVGTGAFQSFGVDAPYELRANARYYLGPPTIDRVIVTNYPSVRAAWADLLRERIDMLYEVSADALDSLAGAKAVKVFNFPRPYQFVIAFNQNTAALKSPAVRRALNAAIDRAELVREAMNGRGAPSAGPIWPQHWALTPELPRFQFDPLAAETQLRQSSESSGPLLRFKCLIPGDQERLALLIRRQLEAVGVQMDIEVVPPDRLFEALRDSSFEAVLLDMVSGPSILRSYSWWHSAGSFNPGTLGNQALDVALDKIRYAASDDEYRVAAEGFQRVIVNDPPAIFLAWSERARAVNRRFDVAAMPGRDVLTTLRLWRTNNVPDRVGRN
jgi:peptide/nickel transport system substrate-binding protein